MPYNYKGDLNKREVVKNCRIWVWMLKALMLLIKSWRRWDCSALYVTCIFEKLSSGYSA